jgi:glucans biosynthesis protein C
VPHAAPSAHHPTDTTGGRLLFLDWLRIGAFAWLVAYHVGMVYVTWDFHVKSPFAGPGLEPWMKLSEPWRMSLVFAVSGAATALMLRTRAAAARTTLTRAAGPLLRNRSRRLLMPLLCGMVLVVPPQPYFEVVQKFGYSGGFVDFLGLYFTGFLTGSIGSNGFCNDRGCLVLPTWNHLWFLPYLWAYTALVCGGAALAPRVAGGLARVARAAFRGPALWLLPALAIFAFRVVLLPRYPSTHAFWGDLYNHAVYFTVFLVGMALASVPGVWDRLARARWPALGLALVCWALWVNAVPTGGLRPAVVATFQWAAVVAAFGWAVHGLNVDAPWRAELTEAVFPVYMLHQTVLIVASQALVHLRWPPGIEAPVLLVLTFAISYLGYRLLCRLDWARPWFGMGPIRESPPGRPAAGG